MITTETAKKGIELCNYFLKVTHRITGINPRVSMMSAPNRKDGTMDTYSTAEKHPELADKVMFAEGERIETQRLDQLKIRQPESWRRLKDYFTSERLLNNPLVRAEKEVLEANGYSLETDYYLAIDIPPGAGLLEKVFFLFATETEKPIMDKYLLELRELIC